MVIWLIIATIYVLTHISYKIFTFGMHRRDKLQQDWMKVYNQQLKWLKSRIKYIFFTVRHTFHSLLRKYVKEELKKDHDAPLDEKFLDYLVSYYTEHVQRAANVINFIYEYKFARYYRKQKKTASFSELLSARSHSLEQNYKDLSYVMEKSRADGYVTPKVEKEWQRHVKRNSLLSDSSLKEIEERLDQRFRKDTKFEQMIKERASVD